MGSPSLRILVADDEDDVRGAVVDALQAAGYETTSVGDGAAALERLATTSFDLASVRVDVRIVSATHRDLRRRIAEGLFREDLFYRLNMVAVHIPPLRDRPSDLPLLVNHFLRVHLPPGTAMPDVSVRAWQALTAYPFLGNVRELGHAIHHAVVLSRGGIIDVEHLPDDITRLTGASEMDRAVKPLAQVLKQAEHEHVLRALAVAGGKRVRAAELLGISRKNLWEKLRSHGISDSDVDDGGD